MLKHEDQLTVCVKIIPSEVSLLWQEASYGWLIPHDHGHKHLFYKVNIWWKQFILCFLSHFWNTQMVKQSKQTEPQQQANNSESNITAISSTYLCPSLPVEHRPSTTPRHRTLFWAALVIPDQLVPCCFSSASVSPPTVARPASLPLPLRVPGQGLACGAGFLRVCPIQPHFLRSVCLETGSCPTRSH